MTFVYEYDVDHQIFFFRLYFYPLNYVETMHILFPSSGLLRIIYVNLHVNTTKIVSCDFKIVAFKLKD